MFKKTEKTPQHCEIHIRTAENAYIVTANHLWGKNEYFYGSRKELLEALKDGLIYKLDFEYKEEKLKNEG